MRINEIFVSIDGECNYWGQGVFTTFIRTQGCNLYCSYCDTVRALDKREGYYMHISDVVKAANNLGPKKVTLTGGEPTIQPDFLDLLKALLKNNYKVSVETNGTCRRKFFPFHDSVSIVYDYKLENEKQMVFNPMALTNRDFIKIVIKNKEDFEHAVYLVKTYFKETQGQIFFSPCHKLTDPFKVVSEMKKMKVFNVGVNIQIHKVIWPTGSEY